MSKIQDILDEIREVENGITIQQQYLKELSVELWEETKKFRDAERPKLEKRAKEKWDGPGSYVLVCPNGTRGFLDPQGGWGDANSVDELIEGVHLLTRNLIIDPITGWDDYEICKIDENGNIIEKGCKKTVEELRGIPFPKCAKDCAFLEMMGVGECESACPEKEANFLKNYGLL